MGFCGYPSSPLLTATQLSLTLYDAGNFTRAYGECQLVKFSVLSLLVDAWISSILLCRLSRFSPC